MQFTYFHSNYPDPVTISDVIGVENRADGSRVLVCADGNRVHLAADWLQLPEEDTSNGTPAPCPSAFDNPHSCADWHDHSEAIP